ncbi:MAG TPA: hypothetical protein GX710_03340 [Clostridiales bacterium]|nr:hypothetical protein [Clostridiales bacterium]
MLNYILGGSGHGKSTELINKIIGEFNSGKRIYVIVPEQFSFEFDKKLYNAIGAEKYNMLNCLTFTTLSKEIFLANGNRTGEYADEMTKTVLMYEAIKEVRDNKWLDFYQRQSSNTAFIEKIIQAVSELRKAGITPDMLIEKTANINLQIKDKIKDIAMIYSTYDKMLTRNKLKDNLTDISEAAAVANMNDYFKDTIFFIDEFESFTGDECEMLDVIVAECDKIYIALRTDDVTAPKFSLFETVNKTFATLNYITKKYNREQNIRVLQEPFRFKNEELSHIERNVLRTNRKVMNLQSNNNAVKIIESKNLYQEVEFVCAEIRRLIIENGFKYSDIAIVSRQISDYTSIFESAFERYDIPSFMDVKKSLMHTSIMVLITSILEIVANKKPDSELIFKYAKTQLIGIGYQSISMLENYCYKWNIDGELWLSEFKFDKNEEIEKIRTALMTPIIKFKKACENATGYQICKALYTLLEEVNAPKNISGLANSYKESGYLDIAKEIKMLWGDLMDMLDVLANLLKEQKIDIENFKNIFIAMLKNETYSMPPQRLDAVTVASAETARLNSPKVTFVVGVNDGIFPSAEKSKGLISDSDKEVLSLLDIQLSRTAKDMISDERLVVYKTLSSASEKLYLSYPLTDNTGRGKYPSFIIEQIEEMFKGDLRVYSDKMGAVYYSSTLKSAYYNYVQGYNKFDEEYLSIKQILSEDAFYKTKLEFLDKASENSDFKVTEKDLIKDIFTDKLRISATRFETYNLCHFKFFCQNGLRIKTRTRKEINSLEKGNLIHYCMEKLLSSCKSKDEFDSLTKPQISQHINNYAQEYKDIELGGDVGKPQRFIVNFQKAVDGMVDLVIHIQEEFKQSKFRPVNFELEISDKQGNAPIRLKTKNGIEVILTGKVDRVDMFEDDGKRYIRVIDYKTGVKNFSLDSLVYGLDMQMLLYLFALTEKKGMYADSVPAGVLYMPSGNLLCDTDREDSKDIADRINSQFKMKGVVLKNRTVLQAMEEKIEGIYIPAKILKDDSGEGDILLNKKQSTFLTEKQFSKIKEHANKLLLEMAEGLYDGDISANPLVDGSKNSCDYCDYWDVCGNVPNVRSREMVKNEEALNELLGGE